MSRACLLVEGEQGHTVLSDEKKSLRLSTKNPTLLKSAKDDLKYYIHKTVYTRIYFMSHEMMVIILFYNIIYIYILCCSFCKITER